MDQFETGTRHPKCLRCFACGHALSGTNAERRCPECHADFAEARSTSVQAIVSLVLGCVGAGVFFFVWPVAIALSIPSIIFGHIALIQVRRGDAGGASKGLAITGLVFGWLMLFVSVVFAVILFVLLDKSLDTLEETNELLNGR